MTPLGPRGTRIFFGIFGAFLVLAAAVRISWFMRGGSTGPEFGWPGLDWLLVGTTLAAGLLLTGAAVQMDHRGRAVRMSLLGGVLFLAQELAALAVAWRWQPRASLLPRREWLLVSRMLLAAVGLVVLWQTGRLRRTPPVEP
jgi:hypothetical protein